MKLPVQHTRDADWGTEWALNPFFLHVHPSVAVRSLLSGLTLLQPRIRLFSEQGSWASCPWVGIHSLQFLLHPSGTFFAV